MEDERLTFDYPQLESTMGLIAHLAEAAGFAVKNVGSLQLIPSKDADAFLRIVKNRNIAILGIEGFRIKENRAIPDMDAIADFSGLPPDEEMVATTIEEAGRFLLEIARPDMYFDFTLEEVMSSPDD